MHIIDAIREQEVSDLLLFQEGIPMKFYRIYFFDRFMEIAHVEDRLVYRKPTRWADAQCKKGGWYTYAIGAIR